LVDTCVAVIMAYFTSLTLTITQSNTSGTTRVAVIMAYFTSLTLTITQSNTSSTTRGAGTTILNWSQCMSVLLFQESNLSVILWREQVTF